MNIKHGGNISKETADLIKELEASGGSLQEYTLGFEDYDVFEIENGLITTTSKTNIIETFNAGDGKQFNERLYELFTSGVLNLYALSFGEISGEQTAIKITFESIDENGVITITDGTRSYQIEVRSSRSGAFVKGYYMLNDNIIAISISKDEEGL